MDFRRGKDQARAQSEPLEARRSKQGEGQRGQALTEMAIVTPVLFFIIAGIIQFGLIFWSQQTLTQVARDTGRWAATQDCAANVVGKANDIAQVSNLFGYSAAWTSANVGVNWDKGSYSCPPKDNTEEVWVEITIDHQIPVFFPFVPGDGNLSTSAEFRMEPMPS
jgi:hypothetical protein